jgi:hypothetical protein
MRGAGQGCVEKAPTHLSAQSLAEYDLPRDFIAYRERILYPDAIKLIVEVSPWSKR